jgi:hypothetical protein
MGEKPGQSPSEDGFQSRFVGLPNRPLIVGGCPRSGTTLLRTMLHAGSEVAIPRETGFVIAAWARRRSFGDLRDAANRRRLATWIFRPEKILARRLGLDAEEAIERLVAAAPALGALLATPFEMFAEKDGKLRWGDKRPKYARLMSCVWDLFPSAQFLNVVRDPRACVASMRELGWFDQDVVPMVDLWERSMAGVDARRRRLASDQLLDVRYEDLVQEPERTLERVARFAGLSAAEVELREMLRFQRIQEWRSQRFHANIARPLDPSRVSRWSTELDASEIAFIEQATRALMERWGYEPVGSGVPVPADLRARLEWFRARAVLARSKLFLKDGLQKRVTHRHPLAVSPHGESWPQESDTTRSVV